MTTETTQTVSSKAHSRPERFVSEDETDIRLDRWFRRHFPSLTNGQLQKWLRKGQIRVEGKRADANTRLAAGQAVRFPPILLEEPLTKAERDAKGKPVRNLEKLKKLVLYQDDDLVVINKPAGLAVQGGTGLKENLDDSLMIFSKDGVTRPKLVHRLDRDTSGILVIARNDYAAAKLSAAFRSHATTKIYWAMTDGVPKPLKGRIDAPLIKVGQVMQIATPKDKDESKSASTLYQTVDHMPKQAAFVALWPLTGRTHQLRVHMASLGTPILGDPLYGKSKEDSADLGALNIGQGLHLHARRIIMPHPRKGLIDVTAPLGPHMKKTWKSLNFPEDAEVTFEKIQGTHERTS